MQGLVRLLTGACAALLLTGGALAQERLALVIGNADYPASLGRLENTTSDAERIAAALRGVGFSVDLKRNLDQEGMERAADDFLAALEANPGAIGFFYYSGHGVSAEIRGERTNLLVPARERIDAFSQIPGKALRLNAFVDSLEATGAKAVFVVSDACRNELGLAGDRGTDKGFSAIPSRPGLLIAYATAEGATAPDDGVFAAALAEQIGRPGQDASVSFLRATQAVAAARGRGATPFFTSAVPEDVCFAGCAGEAAPPVAAPAPSAPSAAELTRQAQELLAVMGYDPGAADGAAGTRTGDAVAAFRSAVGLTTGREIDADLVAALRIFSAQGHRAPVANAVADADLERQRAEQANAERDAERLAALQAAGMAPATVVDAILDGEGASPADDGALRPGETFRDCEACPEMVVIPAGEFVMGSPESEEGLAVTEGPLRTVTVAAFAAGRFEVTWAEWDACVAAGGCDGAGPEGAGGDNGWGRGTRPAINVSWDDAQAYVRWLSGETGESYRLLSEADWEYAARAGTTTAYWWGGSASHEYANYGADSCCSGLASGRDQWVNTSPAGSFSANAFGLHDLHGNVWEWVDDCWHDSYAGAPTTGAAWTSGCSGTSRVLRGGSWDSNPGDFRSAVRGWVGPAGRDSSLGFRVARTL